MPCLHQKALELARILQRNKASKSIKRERERDLVITKNWLIQSWRLITVQVYSQQAEDPETADGAFLVQKPVGSRLKKS